MLDIGCGYKATLCKPIWKNFTSIYLADIDVDDTLIMQTTQKIHVIKGRLPESLTNSNLTDIDVIVANNVLEHLETPIEVLRSIRNCRSNNSIIYINVPSWRGKIFLETAAFKLGLAPSMEMEDHKYYFDKRSLWLLIRSAGFMPSEITIRKTKLGLNITCWIRVGENA